MNDWPTWAKYTFAFAAAGGITAAALVFQAVLMNAIFGDSWSLAKRKVIQKRDQHRKWADEHDAEP